ncbi:MAG: hypothetical protein SCJ93_13145, partial [Bacillota bacterium]|nr:hypothetical protein [Bacillota bacterium]
MKVKIIPGATPDRVRLICLHIKEGINNYELLKEYLVPNIFKTDSFNNNIEAAINLGFINLDGDFYELKIAKNDLENIDKFKYIVSKSLIEDNTYMSYLQNVLTSERKLQGGLSDINDYLRSNNPQIDEPD